MELGITAERILTDVHANRPRVAIDRRMTHWQQEAARSEPSAGIDHEVLQAAGHGIDDEAIDNAELGVVLAPHIEPAEFDTRITDIVGIEVSKA
jgi:hypothetical protein